MRLFHSCNATFSYVLCDSFIQALTHATSQCMHATWLIHTRTTLLIHTRGMTHMYVCYDAFIYLTYRIHIGTRSRIIASYPITIVVVVVVVSLPTQVYCRMPYYRMSTAECLTLECLLQNTLLENAYSSVLQNAFLQHVYCRMPYSRMSTAEYLTRECLLKCTAECLTTACLLQNALL